MDFITGMAFWPYIQMGLQILGSVVVVATVIVGLTPTQKDDEILAGAKGKFASIFAFIEKFSVIQKK